MWKTFDSCFRWIEATKLVVSEFLVGWGECVFLAYKLKKNWPNLSSFLFHRSLTEFYEFFMKLCWDRIHHLPQVTKLFKIICCILNLFYFIFTFRDLKPTINFHDNLVNFNPPGEGSKVKLLHFNQERWRTRWKARYSTSLSSASPFKPGLATSSELHSATCPPTSSPGCRVCPTATRIGDSSCDH